MKRPYRTARCDVCVLAAVGATTLLLALQGAGVAAAAEPEAAKAQIEALIEAVAASGCEFERNGKRYDADAAAAHLRLKYRRGRKYADTAEAFIERLASKSSWSGKPYHMQCPGEARVRTGDWLKTALQELRNASD